MKKCKPRPVDDFGKNSELSPIFKPWDLEEFLGLPSISALGFIKFRILPLYNYRLCDLEKFQDVPSTKAIKLGKVLCSGLYMSSGT